MATHSRSTPYSSNANAYYERGPAIHNPEPNSGYDSDSTSRNDADERVWMDTDDLQEVTSLTHNGMSLRPLKVVELRPREERVHGNFLRIISILKSRSSWATILRGHVFCRNSYVDNLLEKNLNEVTWIQTFDPDDNRNVYDQSIRNVSLNDIIQIRQLFRTNKLFPSGSFREDKDLWGKGSDWLRENARLVCRWKWLTSNRREGSLVTLDEAECTSSYNVDSQILRYSFRGHTDRGGACRRWLRGEDHFDNSERARTRQLDPYDFHRLTPYYDRRYSFGDAFCGAGGASRGAKGAGLRNDWAFDNNQAAIQSYMKNFHDTRCELIDAHGFIAVIEDNFKVDVLHMSPPCVTFSPIYRIHIPNGGGRDHEVNQASFFVTEELLLKCKPRIVTLEETYGLIDNDNLAFFQSMIHMFTKVGFSVRWKVIDLRTLGIPQPRKRLIIIAACPGETLPDFPKPTHCEAPSILQNPGLKPFTTIHDAIAQIPNGFSFHNPNQVARRSGPAYSGHSPLKNTITCSSGADLHPSGTRTFTLREIACLQGVPLEHEFGSIGIRKQIGNMVPPIVAQAIFNEIVKTLRRSDGM